MSVLLIGTGGVGTIVAYGLWFGKKAGEVDVVVRSDYEKVKNDGWEINSCDYGNIKNWKPDNIYPNVEVAVKDGKVYDYVIMTTKNLPDVIKPDDIAAPAITDGKTTIVLIQNGFDLGRPFIKKWPNNAVLSGVSHIGSHNNSGVITQTQKDKTFISYFDNVNLDKPFQEAKAKEFIEVYSNEHNMITYFPDAKWYRYRKLVYNATLNTTCALTGVDTGRLEISGALEAVAIPAMKEVISVAKADGVDLPDDVINTVIHSDDGDWFKPSMCVDTIKGNPIEMEVILGNLLTVARELNVPTPTLDVIYNLLKALQFRLKEARGLIQPPLPEIRPISDKFFN